MKQITLFFGVGAGRCGTMFLANLLNAENNCLCLHEGQIRNREKKEKQYIPFLTLQNYQAYAYPERTEILFRQMRSNFQQVAIDNHVSYFGDIAYNYAPFISVIPTVYPEAKIIFLYRDGRDFVRSVYVSDNPDPYPVGWLDRNLDKVEKFVSLGRLRPTSRSLYYDFWDKMFPIEKNAWLWSETNTLILDGLKKFDRANIYTLKVENLFANIPYYYQEIRSFLNIESSVSLKLENIITTGPINKRKNYLLPHYSLWDQASMDQFNKYAAKTMEILGYYP